MREIRKIRPLVRLVSTLVGLTMMALPAVALAHDGTEFEFEGPLESTSISIPLLGSPLTIDVLVGSDGTIESVSFDPDPGFVADDNGDEGDFTFRFESDGIVYEVEVESEDGTLKIEFEAEDEDEGDDDEGDDDEGDDDEDDDDDDDDEEDDDDDEDDEDDDDEDD